MNTALSAGPVVDEDAVTFRFSDPDRRLAGVRLLQELRRPRNQPVLERVGDGWTTRFPRAGAHRMEYQFELEHPDGSSEIVCDPDNPQRAPGPFGDKSVIEFPGYRTPEWVDRKPEDEGSVVELEIPSASLRIDLCAQVWTSAGGEAGDARPLVVVHDGPEYAAYAGLVHHLAIALEDGLLPPMRAALLPPRVDRDQAYSASTTYARALSHEVLPALSVAAPTPAGRTMRVGMGASLGALAMLHAHRAHPAAFGALFLQSGSFFRQRFDRQEAGFVRFRRISRFVGTVLTAEDWAHPIPVTMTCGSVEENLANNRAVAAALAAQDYDVTLEEHPDAHNWIAWRDVLDPHLVALLQKVWT
ncbi:MAG TPA: alpha/beta hydrolase-fold protein [Actinomycetota bacterium]|nr:alpha/beta hydrolase-fold protein [Actinomycetota bacterium]